VVETRNGHDVRDLEPLIEIMHAVTPLIRLYVAERIWDLFREILRRIEATGVGTEIDRALLTSKIPRLTGDYSTTAAAFDKVEHAVRAVRPVLSPADMWEQSGHTDTVALRMMLAPFRATLPPALFDGLNENLGKVERQLPTDYRHICRWDLVVEGRHVGRLTWPKAYEYASEQLAGTSYGGGPEAMRTSYKRVNRALRRRGKNTPLEVTPG
jgi:hypothetical protein